MYIFLVTIFPCALFLFFRQHKSAGFLSVCYAGLMCAVVFCCASGLFGNSYRLPPAGFVGNFFFYFCFETLLPIGILYAAFWLLSKDTVSFKYASFFPLIAGFYTVFLPFRVFSANATYPFFVLFVKPVLYLLLSVNAAFLLRRAYDGFGKSLKNGLPFIGALIAALCVPAAIEAFWYDSGNTLLWILFSVLYAAAAVVNMSFPLGRERGSRCRTATGQSSADITAESSAE